MSQMEECYRLLEVGPDASTEEIRGAYLTLVNVWHPDRFAHDPALQSRAAEKLKAINGAFEQIKQAPLKNKRPFLAPLPASGGNGAGGQARAVVSVAAGPRLETRSPEEWFRMGQGLANARVEIKADETLTWSHIGDVHRHMEGIRAYQEAIRLRPDFVEAWYQMGLAHVQSHQFLEAARAFSETVRLQPDHASAWINLGAALAPLHRYTDVIQAFREALRLRPSDASVWYGLGVAYADPQIREYKAAKKAFAEAVRLKPELAEAWHALGKACLEMPPPDDADVDADTEEALAAFREAVQLKPDLAEAWCSLGRALARLDRHDDARSALRQALQIKPEMVEAWYRLGLSSRSTHHADAGKDIEEAYTQLRRLDRREASRLLRKLPLHQRLWFTWRGDR